MVFCHLKIRVYILNIFILHCLKCEIYNTIAILLLLDFSPSFLFVFQWHALSREEQAKYYELARKERQLHMQLYPGWSARDNYVSTFYTLTALSSHLFSPCVALIREMCCRV